MGHFPRSTSRWRPPHTLALVHATGEAEGDFGLLRDRGEEGVRLRSSIEDALKRAFRPEFLNRTGEIIIFDPLTQEQIHRIVDLLVAEVEERISEREMSIALTDEAKDWLVRKGYDRVFGARPLKRAVQRYVEDPWPVPSSPEGTQGETGLPRMPPKTG